VKFVLRQVTITTTGLLPAGSIQLSLLEETCDNFTPRDGLTPQPRKYTECPKDFFHCVSTETTEHFGFNNRQ
jgi:hypothetical protein